MPGSRTHRWVTVVAVVASLLALLGAGGLVLYNYSPWFHNKFETDADNAAEQQRAAQSFEKDTVDSAETERAARDHGGQAAPPAGAGWPQWRGPLRDGRAPDSPFRTDWDKNPPKQLWKFDCGGGYSSLAVVGGKAYTQDRQGSNERVVCLDAATGNLLWEYAYPADYSRLRSGYTEGPRATPSIDGNRVYAVGAIGKFVCLEMPAAPEQKPQLAWEHDLLGEFGGTSPQWGVACSPLVEGDLVIVQPGGSDGSVVAFDKASGAVKWKAGSSPSGYSSPVAGSVGDTRVIYAVTADSLLCIRASDGAVLDKKDWITQFGGNIATPIVHKDYLFVSSGYGKGCALFRAAADGDKAKLVQVYNRANKVMRNHHSTCVLVNGYLYGFDDSRLACVDVAKGVVKEGWDADAFQNKGSLILAGKYLVILIENGQLGLVEANPNEFRLVAKVPSGLSGGQNWALPVLVDGRLFLRDNQKVICLDVRPAP
jgi:outer membrane protein assembly factor BamB